MIGDQEPRIYSIPAYVSSAGQEAIEVAGLAGLKLDPWQELVLTAALGERGDGKWSAPTVGLVVGRQNGKNAILEARELVGLFALGEKVIVHSAHEQATSSEHFRRLLDRIEGVPEFDRRILKAVHGKGSEAIELRGGQRVLFKTRTGGGGRGFSVDLLVFDEAMILDAAAKAALVPTMAARSMEGNTQTWYAGSSVDEMNPKHDGVELARVREQGVAQHPRVAYFEWSADCADPADVTPDLASSPEAWAAANPGLGIRISAEWIEHERTVELGPREFAVERLGVGAWPATDGSDLRVITKESWSALVDTASSALDPVTFALDVSPNRSASSIGVAGTREDGRSHVEVVASRPGTGWVTARFVELVEAHDNAGVIVDGGSAAASLVPELEKAGVEVEALSARDYASACGLLFDEVENGRLRHLGTPELAAAVAGATKRPLGDAWAWDRKKAAVNITPLVAITLAHWGAATREPDKKLLPPVFA